MKLIIFTAFIGLALASPINTISVGPAIIEPPVVVDESPISVGPAIVEEESPISAGPVFMDDDVVTDAGVPQRILVQRIVNIKEVTVNQNFKKVTNIGNEINAGIGLADSPIVEPSVGPVVVDESPVHDGPIVVEESPISVGPAIIEEERPISVGPVFVDDEASVSDSGVPQRILVQRIVNIQQVTVNQNVKRVANIGNEINAGIGLADSPSQPEEPAEPAV